MNKTLQLTALVIFFSIHVMAQPLPCFNFEDIPAGTQLGPVSGNSPGDVLFSQAGIQVSLQEILYPDGTTGFGNAMVYDSSLQWLDGQFFFMGNNSLEFNLAQADGALNQLCFDFFDGGGVENFAVNGSAPVVVDDFSEIANLSFPGVDIEVDLSTNSTLGQGAVCITGDIESLLIGGQEFGIDNVCADAVLNCPLDNLRAEIIGCDNAGNYDVEVDFDWLSPLTVVTNFNILIEGEPAATITQADLPYLLTGVQPATDALDFALTVCQADNPDCCASVILRKECPGGECMEFEGLSEASYGNSAGTPPGQAFYTESGISLRLIPFQGLFWTTTYGGLIVLDEANAPEMTAASGQYLKFESVNAVFDLTAYPEPVDSVVVDFYYNGGAINLAANGSSILIQNSLAPGLYALAPGITVRVTYDGTNMAEGQLTFTGNVQSLLIGGEGDFRIDNLCVNPVDEPCELSNMTVDVGPCNNDGTFSATIDFDYQGASDSFILAGPGALSTFAYADLPVTIADAPINNSGIYAYYATDTGPDLCWVGDTIQAEPCTGCAFEGLSIDYQGLSANGQNIIQLDFELTGPTIADFFSVYFDGERYGQFSWNSVPLSLAVPCNTTSNAIQEITVCEGEDNCCITLPLIYLEPCVLPCTPSVDSVSHYLTDCNGDGNYFIVLEQVYPNPPNLAFQFYVAVDGQSTGIYTLAGLPIELGPYSGNGFTHEVAVYTQNTPACPYAFITEPVSCPGACPLESASLVDIQCNDSGFYRATLRVQGAAVGDVLTITSTVSNFSVMAAYTGDGIVVEMPDTGQNYDNLTVCLPDPTTTNADCCVQISFDYPCEPCEVTSIQLEPLACNDDNSFSFVLDFDAQGVFSDTFTLQLSNGFEQIFLYADLPLTLGPIPGLGEQLDYWLTNESGDCGRSGTFLTPDCIDGCVLGQATTAVAAAGCNDDGTYNIPISIENAQFGDVLLVESAVTGHIDTLTYGVLNAPLLQISGWPAPPNGLETLNICFFDQPDCCTTITFPVPCDTDCDFTATVTLLPCEANGLLRFSLTTSSNNPNLPWVMANINGQYFGRFAMNNTVEFGQIINDGSFDILDIVVEAWPGVSTGAACSITVPVDISGCVADCEIPGLEVEALGCTGIAPSYEVQVYMDRDSLMGQNVDIYANGDLIIADAAPIGWAIEVFPYNPGQSQDVITVCYTNDPDCCESIAIEPLLCECNNITDIIATALPCEGDSYFVEIDLEYEDNGFPLFFLNVDGQFYGEYLFSDLPITVGPFAGNGDEHLFHAYGDGQCEDVEALITGQICIDDGCQFTNVIAEPQGCDGNQFMVDVEVRTVNPGAMGYFIFADGQINGPFSYNEPFVTLGPFEGDGSTVYDFLVLDAEDPSCFGYVEVGPIDCGMTCDITNLLVQPLGCNDDGTYNVFLNFDVDFPGNDFFEVYGRNGNLIDFYQLDERPIVIEGLSPSASGEGYLRVCVNDNPNCCEEIEFPEPDCPDACRISDVQAEFDHCDADGNYYVRLSFNVENPDGDGFRVFGNGQDYGLYSYTMPFPVIVGPIVPTGALVYELIVADLNNPECQGFTEFGAFDCNDDNEVCITFDEFETLVNDTVGLAVGSPMDSIYDEAGLIFNAVAIPLGSNIGFFDWVYGFSGPACSNIPSTDGNLGMNGGIEMDFSAFSAVPTTITFDLVYCFAPNIIPQIVIGANGELYSGPITDLPDELPGGIRLEFLPDVNTDATLAGQFTIGGPVEHLVIGGRWLYIDNLCFNQPGPVVDDCVSFDVYDGFPTDTLADFGEVQAMNYEEDGVLVTGRRIEWNGQAGYFTGVYALEDDFCGFGDDDAALSFGGALRFNFAELPILPENVSFDLAFCPGQGQNILLSVNGEQYDGGINDLPDMFSNVTVAASIAADNNNVWTIELTGTVESFEIGGGSLTIDDICFNAPPQEEEVWPGDANADNLAHHIDLLNIGLGYGFQGQPRFDDGADWMGVTAADWAQSFANGTNYKHADCNGDGVVDAADREVLVQNYGRSHGPWAMPPDLPGTDTDPPIYADFPATIPVGTPFTIPLVLGSRGQVVQDIYGIAFTIEFDPQIFNGDAFELSYPVSWFGEPGVNTISIDRTYANEGRIEVALTRTDQNNVSGHGLVAYLIGIIDDIAGYQPTAQMTVKDVVAISVDEERIPVQGRTVTFELDDKVDVPRPDAKGVFSVFPNPTSDWITVTSKYGYQPEQLTLLTLDGREVRAPQEGNQRVSLEGLPAGTYILSIRTGDTRVHKMVVKE